MARSISASPAMISIRAGVVSIVAWLSIQLATSGKIFDRFSMRGSYEVRVTKLFLPAPLALHS
jgi:hypothetical protein